MLTDDRSDEFLRSFLARAVEAVRRAVERERGEVRRALSVPIEYAAGHPPVRSQPGEPPRRGRRRSPLRDSVKAAAWADASGVVGGVGAGPVFSATGRDYAVALEVGGFPSEAPEHRGKDVIVAERPYLKPSMLRMKASGVKRIIAELRG